MVPTEKEKRQHRTAEERPAIDAATWEERAAILEYDGGMNRAEAEAAATAELGPRPEA